VISTKSLYTTSRDLDVYECEIVLARVGVVVYPGRTFLGDGLLYIAERSWQHKYAIFAIGRNQMPSAIRTSFAQMIFLEDC